MYNYLKSILEIKNYMRKIILLLITVLIIAGCQKDKVPTDEQLAKMPHPQTTGLPQPSGGMVITVDNESITSNEVIDALADKFAGVAKNSSFEIFKKQFRPDIDEFVIGKIAGIIVYKHAKRNAGDQVDQRVNQVVDAEVKDYVAQFGGDYAAAEDALKKDGFSSWQDFRDFQKKMILSQSYLASQPQLSQPVTYNEMLAFYNNIKSTEYTTSSKISFQLIDIQPAKMINPDPNVPVLQSARQLAESLVSRIKSGEDFTALARQYSHGTGPQRLAEFLLPLSRSRLQNLMTSLQNCLKKCNQDRLQVRSRSMGIFLL